MEQRLDLSNTDLEAFKHQTLASITHTRQQQLSEDKLLQEEIQKVLKLLFHIVYLKLLTNYVYRWRENCAMLRCVWKNCTV